MEKYDESNIDVGPVGEPEIIENKMRQGKTFQLNHTDSPFLEAKVKGNNNRRRKDDTNDNNHNLS